jgi:ATP-dependent Clp protease ATP-binding subunit ClpA
MNRDVGGLGDQRGLAPSTARAAASAEHEARELGHDRIGTEHLLLGLLTTDSDASKLLTGAGVTLAAARNTVSEAVGKPSTGTTPGGRSLPSTARAGRALGRAARFAHAAGSDIIESEHLLWGVLDVEGTAGQVLRGLGVDVDSLRNQLEALEASRATRTSRELAVTEFSAEKCPSCSVALEETLSYRIVVATADSGSTRDAIVFSCGNCGRVLGVAPA